MSLIVEFPEKYAGKFVARIREKIIAWGDTIEEVIGKVKDKGLDPREVVIDYVPEEEIILIV